MNIIVEHKDCPDRKPNDTCLYDYVFNEEKLRNLRKCKDIRNHNVETIFRPTCPRALPDWNSCDDPPKIEKEVLVYYTIKSDKAKKGYWEYYEVGLVESITTTSTGKHIAWIDKGHNAIKPLVWRNLPAPPKQEEVNDE